MAKNDNPASRLLKIFQQANNLNRDNTALMVWAHTFDVDPKASGQVFYHLFQLSSLVVEIKDKIRKIKDIDADLYLKHLGSIENIILFTNLNIKWKDLYKGLTEQAIYNLEICSDALSKVYKENEVDAKDLKKLKEDIDKLSEKILASSSLNGELKNIILDQLELIRRAISEYRIRGASGLRESLARNLGEIVLNYPLFDKEVKDSEEFKGFSKVLAFLNRIVAKANEKLIDKGLDQVIGLLQ